MKEDINSRDLCNTCQNINLDYGIGTCMIEGKKVCFGNISTSVFKHPYFFNVKKCDCYKKKEK